MWYEDGKVMSEMVEGKNDYLIEKSNNEILSICKYNDNYEKDGSGFVFVTSRK